MFPSHDPWWCNEHGVRHQDKSCSEYWISGDAPKRKKARKELQKLNAQLDTVTNKMNSKLDKDEVKHQSDLNVYNVRLNKNTLNTGYKVLAAEICTLISSFVFTYLLLNINPEQNHPKENPSPTPPTGGGKRTYTEEEMEEAQRQLMKDLNNSQDLNEEYRLMIEREREKGNNNLNNKDAPVRELHKNISPTVEAPTVTEVDFFDVGDTVTLDSAVEGFNVYCKRCGEHSVKKSPKAEFCSRLCKDIFNGVKKEETA